MMQDKVSLILKFRKANVTSKVLFFHLNDSKSSKLEIS